MENEKIKKEIERLRNEIEADRKQIYDLEEKLKCPYNLRPMEVSLPATVKPYQCIKERGHTGNHEFYIQIIGLSVIPHFELESD